MGDQAELFPETRRPDTATQANARRRAHRAHECHAPGCTASCHPRFLMCRRHWRMVPKGLQTELWSTYVDGQEETMTPSAEYLRVAARCCQAVGEADGVDATVIAATVSAYTGWADRIEAAS